MKIRLLHTEDAEAYRDVRLEALKNNPEAFASSYDEEKDRSVDDMKKRFQRRNMYTFGAFIEEDLVGILTLTQETIYKLRHRGSITAMYVSREYRGKAIGEALLKEAIEKAKNTEELEQLYLTVVSTNESAKRLYTRAGFKVFGTEKRALKMEHDTYLDEEHMVLFL